MVPTLMLCFCYGQDPKSNGKSNATAPASGSTLEILQAQGFSNKLVELGSEKKEASETVDEKKTALSNSSDEVTSAYNIQNNYAKTHVLHYDENGALTNPDVQAYDAQLRANCADAQKNWDKRQLEYSKAETNLEQVQSQIDDLTAKVNAILAKYTSTCGNFPTENSTADEVADFYRCFFDGARLGTSSTLPPDNSTNFFGINKSSNTNAVHVPNYIPSATPEPDRQKQAIENAYKNGGYIRPPTDPNLRKKKSEPPPPAH
jgi:hypothetical protein